MAPQEVYLQIHMVLTYSRVHETKVYSSHNLYVLTPFKMAREKAEGEERRVLLRPCGFVSWTNLIKTVKRGFLRLPVRTLHPVEFSLRLASCMAADIIDGAARTPRWHMRGKSKPRQLIPGVSRVYSDFRNPNIWTSPLLGPPDGSQSLPPYMTCKKQGRKPVDPPFYI